MLHMPCPERMGQARGLRPDPTYNKCDLGEDLCRPQFALHQQTDTFEDLDTIDTGVIPRMMAQALLVSNMRKLMAL